MIRRIVPADNSCLFNSVAYALENRSKTKSLLIRKAICDFIKKHSNDFNENNLEKTP